MHNYPYRAGGISMLKVTFSQEGQDDRTIWVTVPTGVVAEGDQAIEIFINNYMDQNHPKCGWFTWSWF